MSVGPDPSQGSPETWGSNVFLPFPAQSPSHSLSKSENHDELFRPVEIAKKIQQFESFVKYLESPVCSLCESRR